MDGTLLEKRSSWATLNKAFGTSHIGFQGLELYRKGLIDYPQFMRRDIDSWPENTTKNEIERILSGYKLRSDTKETLQRLKRRGFEIAMLSGGIDILAREVASQLGIEEWRANGLSFDEDGRLLRKAICRVEPSRKHLILRRMIREKKIEKRDTIAVGDSLFDVNMLEEAGKGFLIARNGESVEPPVIRIQDLTDIFRHI
jgi:phosphoserine phosphatase